MVSSLQDRARSAFDDMRLFELPEALQRNSLRHYYLSIWPPIDCMGEQGDTAYPGYPSIVSNMYMHVPFCSGACTFCNYYFEIIRDGPLSERYDTFMEGLRREVELHAKEVEIKCGYLYVGGGTPSLLPARSFTNFFEWMRSSGMFASTFYATVELHPELFVDASRASDFLSACKGVGINRVSLGLQELNENLLELSNRRHGAELFESAIALIRESGMYWNIDLMYGPPTQTKDDWERSLRFAIGENPDSISLYFLFLNGRTPLARSVATKRTILPTHRHVQELHLMAQIIMGETGYSELPSDFFTKDSQLDLAGRTSHLPSNSHTLPLGPGSYGYLDQTQFANYFSTRDWKSSIMAGRRPVWRRHRLSSGELFRRDIMFSIKNSLGVNIRKMSERWGCVAVESLSAEIDFLEKNDLIEFESIGFNLTDKGRLCVEEIACLFYPPLPCVETTGRASMRKAAAHNFSPSYSSKL